MSRAKSIFVTALVFLMLAIIAIASFSLCKPFFAIIVGFLTILGAAACSVCFCRWLQKPSEEEKSVAPVDIEPLDCDTDFERLWDEIKSEEGGQN